MPVLLVVLVLVLVLVPMLVTCGSLLVGGAIVHAGIVHLAGPTAAPGVPSARVGALGPSLDLLDRVGAWTAIVAGLLLPIATIVCAAQALVSAVEWPMAPFDP